MPILLHLRVSTRGAASYSRRIGQALVDRLSDVLPDLTRIERDLARSPVPHPGQNFVTASLMAEAARGSEQRAALVLSETLIGELEDADLCVIDTPLHNFTVPSALKAWIDHVVRAQRTFRSTPQGKVGLLRNKPVFVVVACGGAFSGGDAVQQDFLTPYLRYVLGVIGLGPLSILRVDSLNRGASAIEAALAGARDWLDREVADSRLSKACR